MIVPLHLLPAAAHELPALPDSFLKPEAAAEHFVLDMPVAGAVALSDLQDFQRLLQAEGQGLQPTRMLYDRLYAFERLAAAHASANPALQQLAMQLFNRYQQAGEWIGLIH